MVAAVKGYKIVLVMPESMSVERRRLMQAYGATFDLTPREKGMKGAIARAEELAADTRAPGSRSSSRTRPTSPSTSAPPRRRSPPTSRTGWTRSSPASAPAGTSPAAPQVLKQRWPALKVFAVEPSLSPVISGGSPAPHPIQGIGAGFVPAQPAHRAAGRHGAGGGGGGARVRPPLGLRGRAAGRHLLRRHAGGDRQDAAAACAGRAWCSASTTTPGSATSPSRTSCRASRLSRELQSLGVRATSPGIPHADPHRLLHPLPCRQRPRLAQVTRTGCRRMRRACQSTCRASAPRPGCRLRRVPTWRTTSSAAVRQHAPARWFLVGHSMGGKVAAVVAPARRGRCAGPGGVGRAGAARRLAAGARTDGGRQAPDDDGLVRRQRRASRAQAQSYVGDNVGAPLPRDAQGRSVADVLLTKRDAWLAWLGRGSREDWADRVGVLHTPALIVSGSEDAGLGEAAQRRLAAPHLRRSPAGHPARRRAPAADGAARRGGAR